MSTKFNPNAQTPQEHAANCRFQLDNVDGWLEMGADEGGGSRRHLEARCKANCLLEAAQQLVASLGATANAELAGVKLEKKEQKVGV